MTLDDAVDLQNRFMIGFDLVLGTATLLAPDATLRVLGHDTPSEETRALFRRCGPIWLTLAAAHALAEGRAGARTGGRSPGCAAPSSRPMPSGRARPPSAVPARARRWPRPGSPTWPWRSPSERGGGAAGGDPAHRCYRHRGLGAPAAPDGAVGARSLPRSRSASPRRPAGPRADSSRRPRQPGLVPQRLTRRRHRHSPRGLDPRPAARIDRGTQRGGHAAARARGGAVGRAPL